MCQVLLLWYGEWVLCCHGGPDGYLERDRKNCQTWFGSYFYLECSTRINYSTDFDFRIFLAGVQFLAPRRFLFDHDFTGNPRIDLRFKIALIRLVKTRALRLSEISSPSLLGLCDLNGLGCRRWSELRAPTSVGFDYSLKTVFWIAECGRLRYCRISLVCERVCYS